MPKVRIFLISLVLLALLFTLGTLSGAAEPGSSNFDTWILLQNPGDADTSADVTFMTENGEAISQSFDIGANSRKTIFANDYVDNAGFSTRVVSGDPIIAERSEYFNYRGSTRGGHAKPGINTARNEWYFAEGTTRPGFEEWLLIQNAGDQDAAVEITFMKEDGSTLDVQEVVEKSSRFTIDVNSVPGIGETDVSTYIRSSRPVIAERTMYFLYNGHIEGGAVVQGTDKPLYNWYFAEGCTYYGFDTWILLMNPGDTSVEAEVYFDTGCGG